ncbi:DUF805 domain-containing protein [Sphingomonas sp.]|uniref:DUF805 domain-containing protein n=1 Tax=Sphingomonas sp. TaxID=28214 RepID=UPI003AFFFFC9
MEWMLMPLKRYAQFSGRSRRQEFWMFFLLQFLIYFALTIIAFVIGAGAAGMSSAGSTPGSAGLVGMFAALGIFFLVYLVIAFGLLIPNIAVAVRRLHDTNRSGLWLLLMIVPYVLGYILAFMGAASQSTAIAGLGGIITLVGLIGAIVLLVFYCLPGTVGPNQYGPDPKGADLGAVNVPPTY